jgi:hypothetical protein
MNRSTDAILSIMPMFGIDTICRVDSPMSRTISSFSIHVEVGVMVAVGIIVTEIIVTLPAVKETPASKS